MFNGCLRTLSAVGLLLEAGSISIESKFSTENNEQIRSDSKGGLTEFPDDVMGGSKTKGCFAAAWASAVVPIP